MGVSFFEGAVLKDSQKANCYFWVASKKTPSPPTFRGCRFFEKSSRAMITSMRRRKSRLRNAGGLPGMRQKHVEALHDTGAFPGLVSCWGGRAWAVDGFVWRGWAFFSGFPEHPRISGCSQKAAKKGGQKCLNFSVFPWLLRHPQRFEQKQPNVGGCRDASKIRYLYFCPRATIQTWN